jgi:hypothetical protein
MAAAIETITADTLQKKKKKLDYRVDVCRITKARYNNSLLSIYRVFKKVNVYIPSLRMKVSDHVYVFGSLLLQ